MFNLTIVILLKLFFCLLYDGDIPKPKLRCCLDLVWSTCLWWWWWCSPILLLNFGFEQSEQNHYRDGLLCNALICQKDGLCKHTNFTTHHKVKEKEN